MPHTFVCPLYVCTSPRGVHTPYAPILLCVSMFLEALYVVGGCKGLHFVLRHFPYITPVWGCLSFIGTPHTQLLASLCIGMFQRYKYVMWASSLPLRGLGVFPHQLGVLGASALECPYAHSCIYFCSALCLMFLLQL